MSLKQTSPPLIGRAERAFREAFERLRSGKPERLKKGTLVSQNNVAKEAGRDPSALKKDRHPDLVREIQEWIGLHASTAPPSPRRAILATRKRNAHLKETISALKVQRDLLESQLLECDAKIIDLSMEIERIRALLPPSNVARLDEAKSDDKRPQFT